MISRMVLVSSLTSTAKSLLIQDAEPGTGTTKSVYHALKDGYSMPTRSVLPFPINAQPVTAKETASAATPVMTSTMAAVSSQPSTMLVLPILVVPVGTGRIKSVSPALSVGSSIHTRLAFQLMITVTPMMRTVPVLHATKVTE